MGRQLLGLGWLVWGMTLMCMALWDLRRRRCSYSSPIFYGLMHVVVGGCFLAVLIGDGHHDAWDMPGFVGLVAGFLGGILYILGGLRGEWKREKDASLLPEPVRKRWKRMAAGVALGVIAGIVLAGAMHMERASSAVWIASLASLLLVVTLFLVVGTAEKNANLE